MAAAVSLVGRDAELSAITALIATPRPGGLLLAGEPGIGKTVLWEEGVRAARDAGWTVLQHRSAQAEAGLAFAGLSDLVGAVFDDVIETIASPRRRALEVALLLAEPDGPPPDSRALGLALLDVVHGLAQRGPVLVALDDVQWMDPSSAAVVGMAVRRLTEQELVVVLATRRTQVGAPRAADAFDGRLDEMVLPPLDLDSLHRLLHNALGRDIPRSALAAIERASGGNPYFAFELARSARWDAGELRIHVPDSLRELLSGRLDRLPQATQSVLLDVAALSRPTVDLVAGDDDRLAALDAAVVDGVVSVDGSEIRFAHPLLASLMYDRSPPGRRRATHARLATLVIDPEERARHLALAAGDAHDEHLAAELDAASDRAAARGATAAAAELAELAIRHTPAADPGALITRRIAAGRLHHQAGDIDRAADIYEELLEELPPGPLRADVLYADALTQRPDVPSRISQLEDALALVPDDDRRAAEILGFLAINRWLGGEVAQGLVDAREGLARAERVGDLRLLATAIARVGWLEIWRLDATPGLLDRGLELERQLDHPSRFQDSPRFTLACDRWQRAELETARTMLEQFAEAADRRGDEVARGFSILVLGAVERVAGRLGLAVEYQETTLRIAEQISEPQLQLIALGFASRALLDVGRLDEAWRHAEDGVRMARAVKDVTHDAVAEGTFGLIEFVRGDMEAARDRLDGIPQRLLRQGTLAPTYAPWQELIEALINLGDLDRAESLLMTFEGVAMRANRWARAGAARVRGLQLLAQGDDAGALRAIERGLAEEGGTYPLERGRLLIALGAAHRHARRTRAARETFGQALVLLDEIGARAWRDKAEAELRRIGGRRNHGDGLTDAEQRVAELAAAGRKNKEIAATLFLGVSTVEMHLSRVYRKLGIRSRTELAARLHDPVADAPNV